ncbi:MAG: aminoacyl-tRNA hydrolase [Thermomicrobiales bacterium]
MSLAERVQRLFGWSRSGPEDELEESEMAGNAETRLIVGLGNPGREYAETRHNAGFMVVDALARRWRVGESRKRFKSEIVEYRRNDLRVVLQMPQTYMNASGVALREAMNWYKVRPEHVLIVVDDLDQPFGQLRMRARGSAGGHNGLSSIFEQLGSTDVGRLRIGIGRSRAATVTHVLSRFTPDERSQMGVIVSDAADAVELWLDRGMIESMNTINGQAKMTKETAAAGNDG